MSGWDEFKPASARVVARVRALAEELGGGDTVDQLCAADVRRALDPDPGER